MDSGKVTASVSANYPKNYQTVVTRSIPTNNHDSQTKPWTPPPGWTNDKEEMHYEYYWDDEDGAGRSMAEACGLSSPSPIMCSTRASGDCLQLFQSGNNYYIWNQIEGDVWQVTGPQGLEDIVAQIRDKKGVGSLGLKEVP